VSDPPPRLEPVWPPGAAAEPAELLRPVRPRERAPRDRPFVYLNMVASVDGRAAVAGRTQALGGPADLELLLELRTLADAVLIGAGTLRAEGYDRLVKRPARRERRLAAGLAADPVAVLLSRRGALPWDARLLAAPDQPVLAYVGEAAPDPPPVAAALELVRLADPAPAAALADLRRRGVLALLCEGGPTLNGALLAAGLVDELFLTLSPLLTGDEAEPTIVAGGPLPTATRLALLWVLRSGDCLFLRYAVKGPAAAAPSGR
jgi:riboflavin biosynthesis pyrimidine reductase